MLRKPTAQGYVERRAAMEAPLPARYNIAAAICDRWAGDPGRPALLLPGSDWSVRTVTFAELRDLSSRLANALAGLGVARGDRVGIVLAQSVECAVAHVAVQRLGAIAVPVSVMAGSESLRHRLLDSGTRVAIAEEATHAWVQEDGALADVTWVFTEGFERLLAGASPRREPVDTTLEDPALIVYTSGTSGQPKGALHAQRVVPAHTESISLAHDLFPQPGDVMWSPADWAWAGGLVNCLFVCLQAGRPIVAYRPRFDPEAVLELLTRLPITAAFIPPTGLKLLRDHGVASRELALRTVMTGGERCGEDTIAWAREQLGLTPNEVYGQTECSAVIGNSGMLFPVKAGSIGLEYPRVRAAVIDDGEREVAGGESGEIAFHRSTASMFLGYWDGAGAAPAESEWHRTGDVGRQDEDGYFWHEGRRDDVILSSGYRIGPGEIEECIARHPAVRAVAVVGAPDELRGQVVAAVLELREGAPPREQLEDELRLAVRSELAPYEVPRRFEVVDELPRTDNGKIRRAELRKLFP